MQHLYACRAAPTGKKLHKNVLEKLNPSQRAHTRFFTFRNGQHVFHIRMITLAGASISRKSFLPGRVHLRKVSASSGQKCLASTQ